jgi:hypothetical protein
MYCNRSQVKKFPAESGIQGCLIPFGLACLCGARRQACKSAMDDEGTKYITTAAELNATCWNSAP